VQAHLSTRAAFYKEVPPSSYPATPPSSHGNPFLALYQTDFEESLKSKEYLGIRTTSGTFKDAGVEDGVIHKVGVFDARIYRLVQD
jgi:hypothetical protein